MSNVPHLPNTPHEIWDETSECKQQTQSLHYCFPIYQPSPLGTQSFIPPVFAKLRIKWKWGGRLRNEKKACGCFLFFFCRREHCDIISSQHAPFSIAFRGLLECAHTCASHASMLTCAHVFISIYACVFFHILLCLCGFWEHVKLLGKVLCLPAVHTH